jgi:uncharacterized protein YndB with AHSA1/START domain
MSNQEFVYVVYIRTTPARLWEALTKPEFTRQCWFGSHQETDWKKGSEWKLVGGEGRLTDSGEVLEVEPMKRLVLKWRNEFIPELKADGFTRCAFDIEPDGEVVKLTVTHTSEKPNKLIGAVSNGWPKVLSSLKSLLETSEGLPRSHNAPKA